MHPETGKVMGFTHALPEDRPGADIPDDAARPHCDGLCRRARLGSRRRWMDLKESSSEKKKARRDHTLEWEAPAGDPRNLDEAHYRVVARVAGDKVMELRSYWKLPETYERAPGRSRTWFRLPSWHCASACHVGRCGLGPDSDDPKYPPGAGALGPYHPHRGARLRC